MKKKDIDTIRDLIRAEFKDALVREILMEKGPRQNGDPEKRVETETVSVLDFLVHYLPLIEGALRGMQADLDKTKNKVTTSTAKLDAVGRTLLGLEPIVRRVAAFSDRLLELGFDPDGHEAARITEGHHACHTE